ncbi:MAG: SUMF1/EgtB/PvdO family nonheme iron enzyme [Gemmatimonadaceae bacterium]
MRRARILLLTLAGVSNTMTKAGVMFVVLLGTGVSRAAATEIRGATGPIERVSGSGSLRITAHVSWKNAWRTQRNHDAAWLFVKLRPAPNAGWMHVRVLSVVAASTVPPVTCQVSADRIGAFCAPATTYRGAMSVHVRLELDAASLPERVRASAQLAGKVFGLEMVFVSEGPFSLGDPDPRSLDYAAFYRSDAGGVPADQFRVTSEAAIPVAPDAGALYYSAANAQSEGDRAGPIPADFPKGTRAFYAMKYQLLQGQYADFLNHIGKQAAFFRAIHAGPDYYDERGTIRLEGNVFVAERPSRPANWVSWDDGVAFADWAGLRPMTELEFTKAARGPADPVAADYPWGSNSNTRLVRRLGTDGDLPQTGDADESRLTHETRDMFGASYYWVMDLAGSVWEKVVTIGHAKGRAFRGTHGDGELREYGIAPNADWPAGDHEAGGYGYRGGGYYERGMPDRDFNPYSPVEWRRYGSWGAHRGHSPTDSARYGRRTLHGKNHFTGEAA